MTSDLKYFAYGSNLVIGQMTKRCPNSSRDGTALLRNYAFQINSRGVANVVASPGHEVCGLLWQVTAADLAALDRCEGVSAGHYVRESIAVEANGKELKAEIYLATTSHPGRPRAGYMEAIVAAATQHGFPAKYVEELKRWLKQP